MLSLDKSEYAFLQFITTKYSIFWTKMFTVWTIFFLLFFQQVYKNYFIYSIRLYDIGCKLINYIENLVFVTSVLHLVAISFERFVNLFIYLLLQHAAAYVFCLKRALI